jgi:L-amino acid N-acyltransferase YncA
MGKDTDTVTVTFRPVEESDMPRIRHIYDYYVNLSTVTFDYETPSIETMTETMRDITKHYPYIVCTKDSEVIGYAYAHAISPREAYKWTVELSIYLAREACGQGYGQALYTRLLKLLHVQNVQTAYACVTSPNPESERMHRKMGFTLLSTWTRSGYKFGQWRDVVWFEKRLGNCPSPTPELIDFKQLPQETLKEILD